MTAQINQRHPLSQQQIEINRRLEGIFQPFASNQPVVRLVGSLTETKMRTMGTVAILLILLLSPVSADDKLVSPELPDEMVGQWCLVDEAPGVSLYEKRQNCRSLIVEKRRLIFMGRVVCTFEDVQRFSKDFRIKGVCSSGRGDRVGDFNLSYLKTADNELLNLLTPPYLEGLR